MNLLTHGRADARHDELIDIIQGQAERRNRFLGNLLDMTRPDAGVVRPNHAISHGDRPAIARLLTKSRRAVCWH